MKFFLFYLEKKDIQNSKLNLFIFSRAPTDHWCAPPDGINNGTWSSNDTGNWRDLAGPIKSDGKIEVQCEMYDINWLDIYQKHQGNWDLIKSMLYVHIAYFNST